MMITNEITELAEAVGSPPAMKIRMLEQMAEALEDQVAALYRRAAAFEEDEFLLNREVEERQTEINRLTLRLEAMQAERDRLMERIESISGEAAAIREEVFNREDESAIAAIGGTTAPKGLTFGEAQSPFGGGNQSGGAAFFRRVALSEGARPI